MKLPGNWQIHDVFHASLVRKYISNLNQILLDLPKAAPWGDLLAKTEKILKVENQHLRN